MAILITTNSVGSILIQTGKGIPTHIAPIGSQYTDILTANLYYNKDGLYNWQLNVDVTNSGSTSGQTLVYLTGGTYDSNTGIATFTNTTGGTFNVNGFFKSSDDIFTTGLTFNDLNYDLILNRNDNTNLSVNLGVLSTDITVTGGTYNQSNGIATFTNTTGGTFNVTGFFKSSDDIFTSGFTFNNSNYDLILNRNDGTNLSVNLGVLSTDMTVTGGTYNSNTGVATFTNNTGGTFNVTGFLTGYTDIFISGGTYNQSNGIATFTNTTGGTFNVSGFNTGYTLTSNGIITALGYTPLSAYTDTFLTGGTYSNGNILFTNNTGGTFNVTGLYTGDTDTYVTGFTYSNNTFTIKQNNNQPDLSVLVTNMTGITTNTIYTDYIDFNTNYTGQTLPAGRLQWDDGNGTLILGLKGGVSNMELGLENMALCFNAESTTLTAGTIVYVSGSQGNRPSIKRAIGISDGYSVTTLGMVSESIASGAEGFITTFGMVNNLDTIGYSGGTPIWLSPTVAGGFTSVKPQAPYHTVLLGYVVRVHASVGSVFVHISNGWEIDELHDVRIDGKSEGDLLTLSGYNGTNVWVNSKTLNGSYVITGDTTVNGQMNAGSISATTYYNLPVDVYTTGGTYSNSTGIATFTNNTGGTFNVSGFNTGTTLGTYLTGATYSDNIITFATNSGTTSNLTINTMTGLTVNGNVTITGNTNISGDTNVNGNITGLSLISNQSSGDEGGEIKLFTAQTNNSLSGGSVTLDIFQNRLRFFETGGANRGVYIDLTAASSGVGTNLLSSGGSTFTGGTVNGATNFTNGLTANTISATTYVNLPIVGFSPMNVGVCDTAPTAASTQYYYQTIAEVTTTLSKVKLWGFSGSDLVLFGIYRGTLQGGMTLIGQARKTCGIGPNELTLTAETGQNLSIVAGEDLVVGYYPDGTSWRTVYDVGISDIYFGITNTNNITTMPATPTGTATAIRFACTLY